jgi:hypothetical protein
LGHPGGKIGAAKTGSPPLPSLDFIFLGLGNHGVLLSIYPLFYGFVGLGIYSFLFVLAEWYIRFLYFGLIGYIRIYDFWLLGIYDLNRVYTVFVGSD